MFYNKQFAKNIGLAFLLTTLLVLWRFTKKMILLIFKHEKQSGLSKPTFDDLKTLSIVSLMAKRCLLVLYFNSCCFGYSLCK